MKVILYIAQVHYLKFLEFGSNVLEGCRNCTSSSIPLGESGIAFGSYFHTTVYVSSCCSMAGSF